MIPQVSKLLLLLEDRYSTLLKKTVESRAGCCSLETQENEEKETNRMVVEPTIRIRSVKELRAFLLTIVDYDLSWSLKYHLTILLDRLPRSPEFDKVKLALNFILDSRFQSIELNREAVKLLLNYRTRSFYGNDLKRGIQTLERIGYKIRVLLSRKVSKSQLKRPKERAEPAHEWLPSWQNQNKESDWREEEPDIWDLLAPAEVKFHFSKGS